MSFGDLQYQGAEALLYRTQFLYDQNEIPAALKYRPRKPYRHPLLDAKLTRHRILSEARILAKLRREKICVPALYALDWEEGWMMMEWIDGDILRAISHTTELMQKVGTTIGRMHQAGVIHGDLTTSNLMLRDNDVFIIDFGLAEVSVAVEDRAVDLYVLERAFGSTHPNTEKLFAELLSAYETSYKGAKATLRRLEDVRMRGRKKIMIG